MIFPTEPRPRRDDAAEVADQGIGARADAAAMLARWQENRLLLQSHGRYGRRIVLPAVAFDEADIGMIDNVR